MKQSFLINDRIYLRAVEPEDMDVMYEMENDPSMLSLFNKSFHDCAWLLVAISKNTAIKASDTMFFFICN